MYLNDDFFRICCRGINADTMYFRQQLFGINTAEITPLDHHIVMRGGTTSTIDMLPHRLDITKKRPPQSLPENLMELTYEIGYLRQEIARYKEVQEAIGFLYAKTVEAFQLLEHGIEEKNIRQRLISHREIQQSELRFYSSTAKALETLKYGLQEFTGKQARSEDELLRYWGIDLERKEAETLVL